MFAVFVITMASVLFYIITVEPNYLIVTYVNMAIHTILTFFLLFAVFFFIRPAIGISKIALSNSISGRIFRLFIPTILISSLLTIVLTGLGIKFKLYGVNFTLIVASTLYMSVVSIVVLSAILLVKKLESKSDRIQARLEAREQLFTEFTENIDLVLWRMAADSNELIYVSPAFEKICGYSMEYLFQSQDNWVELVITEDRPKILEAINQIREGAPNVTIEHKILRADGVISHISNQIFPLKNSKGGLEAILGVATDVTAQYNIKMQRQLLNELHKNLGQAQDISQLSVNILKIICQTIGYDIGETWLLDEKTNTLSCLSAWSNDCLSVSMNSPPAKTLIISEHTESSFQVLCLHQNAIKYSTHSSHLEHKYQDKDGQWILFKEVIGIPLKVSNHNFGVMNFYNRQELYLNTDVYKILMEFADTFSKYIQNNLLINKIKYIDDYDPLTGLYNRESFLKKIDELVNDRAQTFVVIKLQVNNIQLINNTMGYEVGNELLQELSKKYFEASRPYVDVISTLQPGIFGFLSQSLIDKTDIINFVNLLLDITKKPIKENNIELFLTTNAGISLYPEHGINGTQLLSNAIWALIESTKEGSHQYKFATAETLIAPSKQLEIERLMHNAILNNEFELFYQPKISLKTGKITGVEALIRWHDPTNGLRSPDYFMPICEQSDLIIEISDWVLHSALKDLTRSKTPIRTAVNLSARQFNDSYNLMDKIKQLLFEYKIDPKFLEFEVTETLLMENTLQASMIIQQLQRIHIQIALDDFGTGYSSFDYLRKYCPEIIKIDKSFIDGLPDDVNSIKIINAIIALSHSLNIIVVAEGAETAAQVNFLLSIGCDEVQGYYFSKALSFADIQSLIDSNIVYQLPAE
jgi:PAS domain S-box-containing protein/diguanylate cyclase (GGDEF)-like protein